MKLQDIKDKIDAYFDKLNPQELIKYFEGIGYRFEMIQDEYDEINVNALGGKVEQVEQVYFNEVIETFQFQKQGQYTFKVVTRVKYEEHQTVYTDDTSRETPNKAA